MKYHVVSFLCLLLVSFVCVEAQKLEKLYLQNKTYSHQELIAAYSSLMNKSQHAAIKEYGSTDSGEPLHVVKIGEEKSGKVKLLINNAIHPGEPCGVDASLMLADELINDKKMSRLLEHCTVYIIPMYNIGGALLRDSDIRVNQDGPVEYGSRGNAKNLDLNRDFIKCDSKNATEFTRLYQDIQPHVFIDVHTTNGFDYQHVLGLLSTHTDKLPNNLKQFVDGEMIPALYAKMDKKKTPMTPYIYGKGRIPEDGLKSFLDSPRYSSGYAALFNTIGFITEAHKYKPYKQRVEYSYNFLVSMLEWVDGNYKEVLTIKKTTDLQIKNATHFNILWKEDTATFVDRKFLGYESEMVKSKVTGLERLSYDRTKPFEKTIPYYNRYKVDLTVEAPDYYIIPAAYSKVIERLKLNRVEMTQLKEDTWVECESYFIEDFETVKMPFEGHYLHYNVKVRKEKQKWHYQKGDYMVKTDQVRNRYIVETLEPQGHDSFFNWNFFDNILQQKEWFSTFMFDETAMEVLKNNPEIKTELEKKKLEDEDFAKSHYAQMDFIFRRSKYMDRRYRRYPVGRVFSQP